MDKLILKFKMNRITMRIYIIFHHNKMIGISGLTKPKKLIIDAESMDLVLLIQLVEPPLTFLILLLLTVTCSKMLSELN